MRLDLRLIYNYAVDDRKNRRGVWIRELEVRKI